MPVTRSEGKAASKSTTGTYTETGTVTTGTATTGTATTRETTETGTTEYTGTSTATGISAVSMPAAAAAPPAVSPPAVVAAAATTLSVTQSTATTMNPPTTVCHSNKGTRPATEKSTVKRVKNTDGLPLPSGLQDPRTPARKGAGGSTYSKSKAYKLAKAKEDLLRLQVELAAARLATLEHEDSDNEEDDVSIYSKEETDRRVDNWLEDQQNRTPVVAVQQNQPTAEPVTTRIENSVPASTEQKRQVHNVLQLPAGGQSDLAALADAITSAVNAAQRPRSIELPLFSGSHQEWLPFRAAYYETENVYTPIENTNRLRRTLKGKAKEAVDSLLITNTDPADIMKALESRFGRPESIAMMEMDALRALPRLTESPRDICIFATKVSNIVATLKTISCIHYLYNPEVSKTVVDKLTPTLRYRYYDFSYVQPREDPDLVKLDKFLKREADLCAPYAVPEQLNTGTAATQQKRTQKVHNVTERTNTSKCPVCNESGHTAIDCNQFRKLDENGRWDAAKSKRLCFRCLQYRNKTHSCRPRECGVNSCSFSHHKLLHHTKKKEAKKEASKEATEVINSAWAESKKQSFLKIIPIQIKGPKGIVDTFALMDDGSTVTLVDDSVANSIGATGPVDPLKIETINDLKASESNSRRVSIKLKGLNGYEEQVQARTVKNLHVSSQRVPTEIVTGCKHMADIRDYLTYTNAKPKVLIGQDNWHLLLTSEVRRGNRNQPVASRTPLGWVLHGSQTRTSRHNIDFVSHVTQKPEDSLEMLVKQYFEMDALCINPKRPNTDPEERALRILEKNTTRTESGNFQTSLLWRKEDVTLPDNYDSSLKRLFNIEKKIDRDPELKQKYTQQMEALIVKGYAEPAPTQKTLNRTWYLPHFAVVNSMKPDKLRVVHDAAAKTRGVALNDMLLKGPDLLQSLPGVVMRFRQHMVAVTADIKEMFMQVKLRPEDRDALRYLWRGNRRDSQPPMEYRMTSLIFGASSSPSTAIYVKNLNAKQYEETHPEAAAAIVEKHYVDDYLDSFRNVKDAEGVTKGVREIHAKAGFELKQWKSNSPALLETLGEMEEFDDDDVELHNSEEKTERVLGVIWKINSDQFTFNLNLTRIPSALLEGKRPTKREALRIVMSLFDPLGFASPVTIRAKQLLQEVWRRGTAWDDEIDEDLANHWENWMAHLKSLCHITIPRQYLYYSDAISLQLHVFTDASESAYSTVLFWRAVTTDNVVGVSLVMAKAKVAPLKLTSIPRMELQAAVMGARLAETVVKEHDRKPDRTVFWTDSRTVLTWLKTGSRSYKPYVAHRLAAIEEISKVNDWRWVPTRLNVADDATRDVPSTFDKNHRWYRGPDFLYETEDSWPTDTSTPVTEPSGEEKICHVSNKKGLSLAEALPDPIRFSNWDRLRYTAARVLQFIELCRVNKQSVNYRRTKKKAESDASWTTRKKPATRETAATNKVKLPKGRKPIPVSAELLRSAEDLLMRSSQEDSFSNEIKNLKGTEPVNKESRLQQLSVEYVDDAIRLRSRIQAVQDMTEGFKAPLVLDGDHPTVKLWIESIHRRLLHAGVEATVNECRQQYWVLRLRPTTRALLKRCLLCRMRTQAPPHPRTGDLPSCRLAHHKRPFTYTGVDYFGPLSVTVGRARQKRYVALFTCLTTRAIHLEMASSLTADSAIMAVRRMIARRGCPTEIWSDNGTNLKAADRELRRAIDEATAEEAAKRTIAWRYIPPGAPFMGGAWERMVRSVKTALAATLHERHPTEEVLTTLLAEVEYTINSRPLTHVSVSAEDPEALTPNHFLLGSSGRVPQPGTFDEKDAASRFSWRAAQRLADLFWKRWIQEYLPELQHRREPHGRGPKIQVDDLVQVVDTNLPRNIWPRGRVIATYPGPDDIVRTVDVRTKGGVLRRPVRKLVVLPLQTEDKPAPEIAATRSHGGSDVRDE